MSAILHGAIAALFKPRGFLPDQLGPLEWASGQCAELRLFPYFFNYEFFGAGKDESVWREERRRPRMVRPMLTGCAGTVQVASGSSGAPVFFLTEETRKT
jgi:hypothetical protein